MSQGNIGMKWLRLIITVLGLNTFKWLRSIISTIGLRDNQDTFSGVYQNMSLLSLLYSGLYQVIHPEMLSMFCAPELQVIISGTNQTLSVDDLQANCTYTGGYFSYDRHMQRFWAVLKEFNERQLSLLVKFVTSCPRPPSLGFKSLQPPFTIQVSISVLYT